MTTLFAVPIAYTALRRRMPTKHVLDEAFAAELGEASPRAARPPEA